MGWPIGAMLAILGALGCGRIGFDATGADAPLCGVVVPSYVQSACDEDKGSPLTSITVPLAGITAGNTLVVASDFDNTTGGATIADTLGHTFRAVLPTPIRSPDQGALLWYATITDGGDDNVTVTLEDPALSISVYVHEYAGLAADPLDDFEAATGNSTALVTPDVVATARNDLLFAHGAVFSAFITNGSPGYTTRQTCNGNMTQDRVAADPGNYNATFEATPGNPWLTSLAAFRPGCP